MSARQTARPRATRSVEAGEAALTHALFSRLAGSPHDWDAQTIAECLELIAAVRRCETVPGGVDALAAAFAAATAGGLDALARRYSALFEVGTPEPPLPIREELAATAAAGSKEEVVRFYDLFGYEVEPRFAWAPDHLGVLLEFLAWLAGAESVAAAADAPSYALAQRDVLDRHVRHWLPGLAAEVCARDADGPYAAIFAALERYVAAEQRRLDRDAEA